MTVDVTVFISQSEKRLSTNKCRKVTKEPNKLYIFYLIAVILNNIQQVSADEHDPQSYAEQGWELGLLRLKRIRVPCTPHGWRL